MNRILMAAVTALAPAISFAGLVGAGPLEDGVNAAKVGDYATAMRLWRPLADGGEAKAQSLVGDAFALGQGVTQDYAAAMNWYRMAANQGDTSAQSALGFMYDVGKGVPQDYATAMSWYRMAADQGDASAQTAIGFIYYDGRGVPRDNVVAHMWFNLAAAGGNTVSARKRDSIEEKMTLPQIAEAQRLAREWRPKSKSR